MRWSYSNLRGYKTLIVGDVGTGKTQLSQNLLLEASNIEPEIKVLDFAPPTKTYEGRHIGGFLINRKIPGVIHYKSESIKTPRASATTSEELLELVEENYETTLKMLMEFIVNPSKVLFINDVSIHLQHGSIENILNAVKLAETSIINGYMGKFLSSDLGTGVSELENKLMTDLADKMDTVIDLTKNESDKNE